MNTKDTILYLENPWSGAISIMTWGQVEGWASDNVHPDDQREWLHAASLAAQTNDAALLGNMIIGS